MNKTDNFLKMHLFFNNFNKITSKNCISHSRYIRHSLMTLTRSWALISTRDHLLVTISQHVNNIKRF